MKLIPKHSLLRGALMLPTIACRATTISTLESLSTVNASLSYHASWLQDREKVERQRVQAELLKMKLDGGNIGGGQPPPVPADVAAAAAAAAAASAVGTSP